VPESNYRTPESSWLGRTGHTYVQMSWSGRRAHSVWDPAQKTDSQSAGFGLSRDRARQQICRQARGRRGRIAHLVQEVNEKN